MMKTISEKQLFRLSAIARAAWIAHGKPFYVKEKRNSKEAFDKFRKGVLFRESSNKVDSWSKVLNADFEKIEAAFAELAGEAGVQFNAEKSKAEQPRKRKLAAISKMLAHCGHVTGEDKWCMGYARTIARQQYGGDLDAISEPELHRVMITVTQRTRAALRAFAAAKSEADETAEGAESAEESDEATTFADADAWMPEPEPLGV